MRAPGSLCAAVLAVAVCSAAAACGSAPVSGTAGPAGHSPPSLSPSAEVIAARMGLTRASGYAAYTAATDPNHLLGRVNGYTSKVSWGPDGDTGTIEVYPDAAGAIARQQYVSAFACPFGWGYLVRQGTADLRLGCDLTPAQAAPVEARFREAG